MDRDDPLITDVQHGVHLLLGFEDIPGAVRPHDQERAIGMRLAQERRRLEGRLGEPTLWDGFLRHLARRGHPVPKALLERDVSQPCPPSPEVQLLSNGRYHVMLTNAGGG